MTATESPKASVWMALSAFTMAEILLSLTIIGVVAAITLPSLTGNINERTWNTQRKALYARFSQAISLMPSLNGYGTLNGTLSADGTQTITEDNATETFVTAGLSKVLKINNICDYENLSDCGIPNKITTIKNNVITDFTTTKNTLAKLNNMFAGSISNDLGSVWSYYQLDTKAAAFETANGESIVVYYNPNCKSDTAGAQNHYTQPLVCANFIYDLNGTKGPNTVGKDIGVITALYASDPVVVAPMVTGASIADAGFTYEEALSECRKVDEDSRIPNKEEATSMFVNRELFDLDTSTTWSAWTSSMNADNGLKAWLMAYYEGALWLQSRDYSTFVRCVKR